MRYDGSMRAHFGRRLAPVLLAAPLGALLGCRAQKPKDSHADAGSSSGSISVTSGADVTSHASPLPSPAGDPALVADAIDAEPFRARNRARISHDRSPVIVLQSHDPHPARDLGKRLCEAVVPKKPPATPILLKPNIGGFDWFKDPAKSHGDNGLVGRITDPEFVRGVIQCLRKRGHDHITIAEGWGATHKDWLRLIHVSGYEAMAREEHTPLVALDDDGVFDVEGDQPGKPIALRGMEATHVPTLLVPKLLAETLDHGMFISLPKIKAHRFGVLSMALKGMQGTVMLSDAAPVFHQKWRMHREINPLIEAQSKGQPVERSAWVHALETFAERIVDVFEVEAPDVVLAEGAPAMGGDGFEALWPLADSVAIGGTNPILVDRVGAEILGLWDSSDLARELGGHRTSPLLEAAAKRFGIDLTLPPIVGDGASLVSRKQAVHFVSMAGFELHSDPSPPMTWLPENRPVAHASRIADGAIVVDGRGEDLAWSRASPTAWETDYAGQATGIVTRAQFLYSSRALYVLWHLESTGLNVDRSRPVDAPRARLYEEDCVELFFTPDRNRPSHYYEMEQGPFGHFWDLEIDCEAHTSNTAWSSGARVATTRDPVKRIATIEAELTAPDIVRALVPGARLPLGLYRMEGKDPRHYLAWSPPRTAKPNFHVPEAFGVLALDP
jgi:uncharacterized protein (DUF362 family)